MKKFLIAFAFMFIALAAKEVAMLRALHFYAECLSPEEIRLVESQLARKLPESELTRFTEEKISCIESKQTLFERVTFRVMGKYFFYPIFFKHSQ